MEWELELLFHFLEDNPEKEISGGYFARIEDRSEGKMELFLVELV